MTENTAWVALQMMLQTITAISIPITMHSYIATPRALELPVLNYY